MTTTVERLRIDSTSEREAVYFEETPTPRFTCCAGPCPQYN